MQVNGNVFLITGGASGLGLATARALIENGARVVIADLPTSPGAQMASELGRDASFIEADVTSTDQVAAAVEAAVSAGSLRGVVHTAGRGGSVRLVDSEGAAGDVDVFESIVRTNLVGSFNVAAQASAAMSQNYAVDGERGAIVFTSSVAAFEGQIGQAAYAASKAGIVGLTLTSARDLAKRGIRVCTIAPGLMDTPLLGRLRQDIRDGLAASVPNPPRLGLPEEFASLALEVLRNPYLNGETLRLDGAIRMAPR